MERVDTLDVADIDSEAAHAYQWDETRPPGGFPTEYNQFDTVGCAAECSVMDGGRRINGEERFSLAARPGEDLLLVTRLHPADAGTYDVYANDQLVSTRTIPALPGAWLEVPTLIPGALVTDATRIRIVPHLAGDYMPYYHWAYQGTYPMVVSPGEWGASFQAGAVELSSASVAVETTASGTRELVVTLDWFTSGAVLGDAKIFVHVLDAEGQIVAQVDTRPARGALPPGNWLPGQLRDEIRIDVPPGNYRVIMGLYDPVSFDRWQPEGEMADANGSVLIGEVEVQ
jgi:hypothetical protein